MLRKTSSSADLFRGFIFIPLVIALIFFFACSETENSDTSAQDKTEVAKSKAKKAGKDDQVFVVVEKMPKFRGEDVAAFRQYIQQQVSYPEEAAEKGLEGTSFVRFIVDKQGEVENVKVVRSTYPIFGETAAEAIRNAPSWEPGKQRGQKVRVQFTIPVVFKLKE
jgi:TonB family protein